MLAPTLALVLQVGVAHPALAVVEDSLRPHVNLLHYDIAIAIPDTGTAIAASVTLRYVVRAEHPSLRLDFDSAFTVDSMILRRLLRLRLAHGLDWRRTPDGALELRRMGHSGDTLSLTVHYHGRPREGLFIQDNVHGRRTAFADNWPNRARHWFPAVDHPSDKASVAFHVDVPEGWRVVANGLLSRVDTLPGDRTRWHWAESRRIPVYTMVFGAGRLAVAELGTAAGVPHTAWVFPEDSAFAVSGPFARARLITETLASQFGPFPYGKLAHVESSTRFGGMENSSAIFYTERAYADRTMGEGVVVHEVAHQWFGDAVTEHDWHHLWLSEGFATYLGALFYELVGEHEAFRAQMDEAKRSYFTSDVVDRPVIDTTEKNLFALLNANNYPKGAWVLHMLRREVGDSAFFRGMRDYYTTFRDSTALTSDLTVVMERQAGRDLDWFFRQWLLQPGYPRIQVGWSHDAGEAALAVMVRQVQPDAWGRYRFVLPVELVLPDGTRMTFPVPVEGGDVRSRSTRVPSRPTSVRVDPEGDLLLELVRVREGGVEP
jgi:aminopeptidase N